MKQYDMKSRKPGVSLLVEVGDGNNAYCRFERNPMVDGIVSFETQSQEMMKAIENCAEFKSGLVWLALSTEEEKKNKPLKKVEQKPVDAEEEIENENSVQSNLGTATNEENENENQSSAGGSYPEVTSLQQAKEVLAEKLGLAKNHPSLRPKSIMDTAAKNGFTFPNLVV